MSCTCENIVLYAMILYLSLAFLIIYNFYDNFQRLRDIGLKIEDIKRTIKGLKA